MIRFLKTSLRKFIGLKNETDFFGQAGEDAIVLSIIKQVLNLQNGFYIDIGAFHPFRHSNTYILYKAGWSGVNIDPRPGTKKLFDRARPRDINIEAGVGDANTVLPYYILGKDSTMNTFSKNNLLKLNLFSNVERVQNIPVHTLKNIFEIFSIKSSVDYLNIDAEGFEIEILSGIPFSGNINPKLISIEQNSVFTISDVQKTQVYDFLTRRGY